MMALEQEEQLSELQTSPFLGPTKPKRYFHENSHSLQRCTWELPLTVQGQAEDACEVTLEMKG